LALAVVAVTACSFVGASVPDHPPAPEHCPEGVVVLDIAGTGLFLVPATVMFGEGLRGKADSGTSLLLSLPTAMIDALRLSRARPLPADEGSGALARILGA
jgi:hypothetical protein